MGGRERGQASNPAMKSGIVELSEERGNLKVKERTSQTAMNNGGSTHGRRNPPRSTGAGVPFSSRRAEVLPLSDRSVFFDDFHSS